jgi:hypothetical protein
MIKIIQYSVSYLLFVVLLALTGSALVGCEYFPESTFKLASDSRLPRWIVLPPGLTRNDVSITMNYYMNPFGRSANFILQDSKHQVLQKVIGKVKCKEPFHLNTPEQVSDAGYPFYEAITVNGVTEMIQHRKMEPTFYITDDDAVWKHFRATGCS